MTTVAAPDTSSRGCLSVAAGTTLQQLAALIPPCALTSTIRCRTDSSGFIVDTAYDAHPYDPSATVSSYSRPTTESGQRTPKPSQHAAILSPEPFAGLPIGHKGAFPVPTVSAPNRPNHDILLQTTESADRDPGPKSVARSRPPTSVTCQRITTRIRDALTSSARWKSVSTSPVAGRHAPPPRQSPFSPCFPTGPPLCRCVCTLPSIAFSRSRPECGFSTKCSQGTSRRRAVYACASYGITTFATQLPNSNCCTPPGHG